VSRSKSKSTDRQTKDIINSEPKINEPPKKKKENMDDDNITTPKKLQQRAISNKEDSRSIGVEIPALV
jgi:hypothetical protein